MRVLLVAYHFPPDRAVGALRAAKIADAFRERGHSVHVISARLPSEADGTRPGPEGTTIRTVRPLPGPRQWWAWLKRKRSGEPDATAAQATSPAPQPRAPWWRRWLLSMIWTPDDRKGFILPALLVSLPEAWKADLIYSTAPPFSDHLLGLLLRWFSWKPLVVEFRDPWTDNSWKPENARSRFSEAIERWMERRSLGAAHRIVCVSDGIARLLARRLGEAERGKLLVVRNGIDELLPPRGPRETAGPIRIVHIGTFYFNRDPMPFLRALAALHQQGTSPLELHLVGRGRWYRGNSIEDAAAQLGLGEVVRFQDWVEREESQRITRSADLLLLLAQGQPAQIPNKLYEYLGTRIPILAFADAEGESAHMLQTVGGHVVVSGTDEVVVGAAVGKALELAKSGRAAQAEAILREWTTTAQMERLFVSLGPDWSPK